MRRFLWGGSSTNRKICRVRWSVVSRCKSRGGLGVTPLWLKNCSLLFKWLWRMEAGSSELWQKVIQEKYGLQSSLIPAIPRISKVSNVWKDIISSITVEPFASGLRIQLGNGDLCRFWLDPWASRLTLKTLFPRLFRLSTQPTDYVAACGKWNGLSWEWRLFWKRPLWVWETELLEQLLNTINLVALSRGSVDKKIWTHDPSGIYSCRAGCLALDSGCPLTANEILLQSALQINYVPPKVKLFLWLALQNRISTKAFLCRLGIIEHWDSSCHLCGDGIEDVSHLFIKCKAIATIWYELAGWWGIQFCPPVEFCEFFSQWRSLVYGKNQKKVWTLLFLAAIWSIWLFRNDMVFKQKSFDKSRLIHLIFARAYFWMDSLKEFDVLKNNRPTELPIAALRRPCLHPLPQSWCPPLSGSLKWNIAGLYSGLQNSAGIGGVLRNYQSNILCLFSSACVTNDPSHAILIAITKALELSCNFLITANCEVTFELHSADCVSWLSGSPTHRPWRFCNILNKIENALAACRKFHFVLSSSRANSFAVDLANQGIGRSQELSAWL